MPRLFEKAKVAPDLLKTEVEEEIGRIPRVTGDTTTGQGVYVTQRLNKLLVKAQDEAKKLKDEYVSVEHLVLAMFDEPATHRHRQDFQDARTSAATTFSRRSPRCAATSASPARIRRPPTRPSKNTGAT